MAESKLGEAKGKTLEAIVTVKFMNEISLSIKNGFENNVKFMKNVLVNIFVDAIVILPQKDVPQKVVVPMTNIASYVLEER